MKNSNVLTIDDIGQALLVQLNATGWEIEIDTDYTGDFKHFCAFKENKSLMGFDRLDLILMILNNNPRNVEIRFVFYADPKKVGESKRYIGKKVRGNNFKLLRSVCERLLNNAEIKAKEEETEITSQVNHKIKFEKGKYLIPVYKVEMVYWRNAITN